MTDDLICICGHSESVHVERTHEVERGTHYCAICNSIHDLEEDVSLGVPI
jgi:hypothetical protein